jgi:hypothetical protein
MTLVITFLAASVFSSILVVAAGILSSRANRRAKFVENFAHRYTLDSVEHATQTPLAEAHD